MLLAARMLGGQFQGEIMLDVLLMGLAVGYATEILLLEQKDSHEGPFKIPNWFVEYDGHCQRFVFFDLIRFITGAYHWPVLVEGQRYFRARIGSDGLERWTCPTCLSLWVALPFSAGYSLLNQLEWFYFLLVLLAVTSLSNLYNRYV